MRKREKPTWRTSGWSEQAFVRHPRLSRPTGPYGAAFAAPPNQDRYLLEGVALRPHARTQGTKAIIGLLAFGCFTPPLLADSRVGLQAVGATLLLAGVFLAVQLWRTKIVCSAGRLVVHELIQTRRIPIRQVVAVRTHDWWWGRYPVVRWQDPSGRRHRVLLLNWNTGWAVVGNETGESGPRYVPEASEWNGQQLSRLVDWINLADNR